MPHPLGSASLPCHSYTRDTCLWELVALKEEDKAEAELSLQVPCGHKGFLSHLIVAGTMVAALAGGVAILCGMAKMQVQSDKDM